MDVEEAVRARYSAGAKATEAALCCPVDYDRKYLEVIPDEVKERDYGCGDPSRHLAKGETVLDLGSGTGKIAFIAAQVVGASGRVIGVDMNDDMLGVARRAAPVVASRIGFSNVEFRKGKIQDLALDREALDKELRARPVTCEADFVRLEEAVAKLREKPLVASDSVDVVVSNCVLNLVRSDDKQALFSEIFRVLKRGGRAIISDIVSDEDVPGSLRGDPELWSGCISGAFREDEFLRAFEAAGFYGIEILERGREPWRVVEGIEFRSVTVAAWKGKQGPCLERKQAVLYKGPFKQVEDDDGHVFRRGVRTAVCDKTFQIFAKAPYRASVDLIEPAVPIPLEKATGFPCTSEPLVRHARETKDPTVTLTVAKEVCGPSGCC